MQTVKFICLLPLLVAAAMTNASGQTGLANINPALLYYQAFLVAPTPMSYEDAVYPYSKEGVEQKLPARFDEIVARYDNQFKLVRQAARSTVPCDWGIDFSEGPATLVAHMARAKGVALASRLRVRWKLEQDRQADARDDLVATVALGRNLTRDGTSYSVGNQIAIEGSACTTVAENFGRFSPETLKQVVDGLDAAPSRGTVAGSILSNNKIFLDWRIERIAKLQEANAGDDAKVLDGIRKNYQDEDRNMRAVMPPVDEESSPAHFLEKVIKAGAARAKELSSSFAKRRI